MRFQKDPRYKTGIRVGPKIALTQKDKEVLIQIQTTLKMGKMYFHKRDGLWYLEIYKHDDIKQFLDLIKNIVIVKKRTLEKFEFCINMMTEEKHLTREGVKKMQDAWLIPNTAHNTP